jgi:general secretion pathway protein L
LTTLYIRHPARADHDASGCQFALVADGGALLQQGSGALGSMKDLVAASGKVVLLLAAPDVTVLQVAVPPLSNARLKAALPGLVEDHLLGDAADCVIVAASAAAADGKRAVAVVQRSWLEALVKALLAQGARSVAAMPGQLCLPLQPGHVSAAIGAHDISVRHSLYEGMGLAMSAEPAAALQTVRALAGDAPLDLYVPPAQVAQFEALAAGASPAVTVAADHWNHWIAGAKSTTLDLVAGMGSAGVQARDWQRWRWPLRLAALALLVNLAAINIEWMRLKREADTVRSSMLQTFKATFPKETVILDPMAQMRKNLALAKRDGGQLAADEFTFMAAAFGEAARALGRKPAIAALDYREKTLNIKLKPDPVDPQALAQMKAALAQRGLALSEAGGNWVLRATGAKP